MEQLREELLRVVRCLAEQSMGPEQLSNTAEQLEYFSGENDSLSAEEWLARFEISKQIGRWSEERTRMVLLVKLTSAARLWHLREGAYAHKFDDWKEQFLQMFSEPVRVKRLVEDLEQRVDRSKDDPLQRYVWRAAALAVAMGMSAPDAKSLILNGLPQHDKFFRDELQNRESSNYNDLVRDIEKTLKFKREMPTTRGVVSYRPQLCWVQCADGARPPNAVKGGVDSDKEVLYVARAVHGVELIPGKLKPSHSVAYIPFDTEEHPHRKYEVLVADCAVGWVEWNAQKDDLPAGAIEGGYALDREPFYIARVTHWNAVTCGKLYWPDKKCYIAWGGEELDYENYEVLVCLTLDLDASG